MGDTEYNTVWPGTYGHFVGPRESASRNIGKAESIRLENGDTDDTSLADLVVDAAIEEALIRRAEKRRQRENE